MTVPRPPAVDGELLEWLTRLVQELGSKLELDQFIRDAAVGIREHVDYDTFAVLLLDDLGQDLHFRFAHGYSEDVVRNWRFGLGQGLVGLAARHQRLLRVGDVSQDPRYIGAAAGVRSEMAVPLVVENRTIGVLDVGSNQPNAFTEAHERLMTLLAGHLANGIENARLYENVRAQASTLALLHETSRELTSILDREALLRKVAELVKRLIDYKLFSVMLWNETTQVLEHTFSLGFDRRFLKKDGFPLGHGVTGTAAALRQPIRVPNVHLNPHYRDYGHGVQVCSELAVPLVFKDRLIGVLDLESTEYNAFTAEHEQMLSTLGSYLAVALENARLYAQLAEEERRLEVDLETARGIQKGLLPHDVPPIAGLAVGFAYEPARLLGGDFYDFLPYGPERLAIVVGDVAGKGTPAALYAALAVGMLRGHVVEHPHEPAEMLERVNQQLGRHRIDNRYVAMTFAVYDGRDRSLTLASGGFPLPLLVRQGKVEELNVHGLPVGMMSGISYEQVRVDLQPGDLVVFCSDGIWESSNQTLEEFGVREMQTLLVEQSGRTAQEVADSVLRSAERYIDGRQAVDDRTVVVLKLVP